MKHGAKHPTFALRSGAGVEALEQAIRQAAGSSEWDVKMRLPTTRELGAQFGVSNATASRLLDRLGREGVLWRRVNGRYYRAEGAKLFAEPKTYACLLRRLENWSRVYFGIMSGFSRDFAQNQDAMLFFHNEQLVRHTDTSLPPVHAGPEAQTRALREYLAAPRENVSGFLLDDVWRDEVLALFQDRLAPAVVVCRTTKLMGVSSVSIDFASAAMSAIAHLFARGYEEIVLAVPFTGALPVEQMITAAKQACAHLGKPLPPANVCLVSTVERRQKLFERLKSRKVRTGIFCPEDNVALQIFREARAAGLALPQHIGLVSGMGTDVVAPAQLSTLRIDYPLIGQTAAQLLREPAARNVILPVQLKIGATT